MGGRRKKHQGAPEPIDFAKLKRKAGLPVDSDDEEIPSKKRRTAQDAASKTKGADLKNGKKANGKSNGSKIPAVEKKTGKSARSKIAPVAAESDDEISDGLGSGFDDEDVDEFSDLEGEDVGVLGDDFLGSSDEDSVYDSDNEAQRGNMFSEDEDDGSDAEEKLTAANIEGLSRKLDEQQAEDDEEAEKEMEDMIQTNIDGERPNVLGDDDEGLATKTKALLAPDLQLLRQRITDTIRVLGKFSQLAQPGRSRSEYTQHLIKDIALYYGYNEFLCEKLYNLFDPQEAFAFFEANESARPVVIRTNTLKTHRRDLAQALINRGVVLEPVGKWSKVGLQVFESTVPLGATPEYLAGHYLLQAASSFLPVMALQPLPSERCLDMSAAPGGKTTHMAALMKNTGCIFANDASKSRSKGLIGNIHRLGVRNTIVCNYDAREIPGVIGGFDRVLLDAPCTGTGVIAKDQSVKTNRTEKDFMTLPHTQKQLLLAAIDSVNHKSKTGGYIVYSTCSVCVEENEQVVQYALSKRPNVKLVDTEIPFGKEGFVSHMGKKFDASLRLTRRYYPHTYNMDGFFVAKFKKVGPSPSSDPTQKAAKEKSSEEEVVDKTPIVATEAMEGVEQDDFGGFNDEEDNKYIERAKKNAMRRRGLDPKLLNKGKSQTTKERKQEKRENKQKGAAKA